MLPGIRAQCLICVQPAVKPAKVEEILLRKSLHALHKGVIRHCETVRLVKAFHPQLLPRHTYLLLRYSQLHQGIPSFLPFQQEGCLIRLRLQSQRLLILRLVAPVSGPLHPQGICKL